jgi:hypothetical protein
MKATVFRILYPVFRVPCPVFRVPYSIYEFSSRRPRALRAADNFKAVSH